MMSFFARHRASPRQWAQGRLLRRLTFPIAVCVGLSAVLARAQVPDVRPTGYVNDFAGVLSAPGKQQLEALAAELDRKTGSQLAIVTVNSLQGEPIEDFSVKLATRWGIGRKSQGDTGVMLLLATQDRKSRMEVGYGIEPSIPDGRAGMILRDMRPQLQAGDYDGALMHAAGQVASFIAQAKGVELKTAVPQQSRPGVMGLILLVVVGSFGSIVILFVGMILFSPFLVIFLVILTKSRRGGWYGGSTDSSTLGSILGSDIEWGGSESSDFSSGSFGGFGGGGFGGGGASSSW